MDEGENFHEIGAPDNSDPATLSKKRCLGNERNALEHAPLLPPLQAALTQKFYISDRVAEEAARWRAKLQKL